MTEAVLLLAWVATGALWWLERRRAESYLSQLLKHAGAVRADPGQHAPITEEPAQRLYQPPAQPVAAPWENPETVERGTNEMIALAAASGVTLTREDAMVQVKALLRQAEPFMGNE